MKVEVENIATITEPMEQSASDLKLQSELDALNKAQFDIERMRQFIHNHSAKFDNLSWSAGPWWPRVVIEAHRSWGDEVKDPREIARRFPGVVWIRTKNDSTCGVIDFVGELDGMKIIIENAETIQFKDGGLVAL